MSLEQLINTAKVASKEIVEKHQQELSPVMLVEAKDTVRVIGGWHNVSKERFSFVASAMLRDIGASCYVFVTEAWACTLPQDSSWAKKVVQGELQIRDLPPDDRADIINLTACERGKPPIMLSAVIDNTPSGRKVRDFIQMADGTIGGRLVIKEW